MKPLLWQHAPNDVGERLYRLAEELFPIIRSITGQGVRDSLGIIDALTPVDVHSIPTGTQVFDWVVPDEWNLRRAYIEDSAGHRIVDSINSSLHVVSYSTPVNATVSLDELRQHLHTLPEHPEWIPYRTSYYRRTWGFCLSHQQYENLTDQRYRVTIDATLAPGVLNYGEAVIAGETNDEVLISAHICHPSLCNDNLSGITIAAWLARLLRQRTPRYTYRILFAPGTIGTIAWLATHRDSIPRIKHGLVVALLGRPAPLTYKRTRSGTAEIDNVVSYVLSSRASNDVVIDFSPWGYDERQYNSPGIAANVGRLTRAAEEGYPEYHTSADNLDLITPEALADALQTLCAVIDILEGNDRYRNLLPYGEPHLGKYGLYNDLGGASSVETAKLALLWVLNQSDGASSLLDIAQRSGLPFADVQFAASRLEGAGLLERMRAAY